jgi:hypothetical protein
LVYHFGTPESVDYANLFFPVNETALLYTNLLNTVGVTLLLSGFLLGRLISRPEVRKTPRPLDSRILRIFIIIFLILGLSIKYLFAFPYYMGWISWTLPGGIQYLSALSRISIILLFIYSKQENGKLKPLLYLVIAEETIISLMTLAKLAVFEVMLSVGLGWYISHRPSMRKLLLAGISVVLTYALILSPFMGYARIVAGSVGVGSVGELTQSISGFASADEREDYSLLLPGVQSWWTRLSYTNAQSFAMQQYDAGAPGDTLSTILYAVVPRILFPDKPMLTPGREFTTAITGQVGETATVPGVFAEAYWNGGWPMVVMICLLTGFLFWHYTSFAEKTVRYGLFQYLPVVMIGVTIGYSPADWFVSTFIGPTVNGVVLYVVIRFLIMPIIVSSALNIRPAPSAKFTSSPPTQ